MTSNESSAMLRIVEHGPVDRTSKRSNKKQWVPKTCSKKNSKCNRDDRHVVDDDVGTGIDRDDCDTVVVDPCVSIDRANVQERAAKVCRAGKFTDTELPGTCIIKTRSVPTENVLLNRDFINNAPVHIRNISRHLDEVFGCLKRRLSRNFDIRAFSHMGGT